MGVKLTEEEIDTFLTEARTLVLSTIRKSGEPFMTPVWYAWLDGAFWLTSLAKSAKVQHIRRDPRVCCLVEEGERWIELKAVVANCDAEFVEDADALGRVQAEIDRKYAAFRLQSAMPKSSQAHYANDRVVLKLTPRPGELRSWWNRKLRLPEA